MSDIVEKRYWIAIVILIAAVGIVTFLLWPTFEMSDIADAQVIEGDVCEELVRMMNNRHYDSTIKFDSMVDLNELEGRMDSKGNTHTLAYDGDNYLYAESINIISPSDNSATPNANGTTTAKGRNHSSGSKYSRHHYESDQWSEWEGELVQPMALFGDQNSPGSQTASDGNEQGNSESTYCDELVEAKYVGQEKIQGHQASRYLIKQLGEHRLETQEEWYIKRDIWIVDGQVIQTTIHQSFGRETVSYSATFSGWDEPNIIVAPVTGTLHEAFITTGTDTSGAVASSGSTGRLEPAEFATAGGTDTEIEELKWESGSVSLKLNPYDTLTGYVLDFFNADGVVSLSLDASSATADATNGTLSWAVAEAPWQDGDHLMLRIRETGSQPIPVSTPEPQIWTAYFFPNSAAYTGGAISLNGCMEIWDCVDDREPDDGDSYLYLFNGGSVRVDFPAENEKVGGAITDVWFEVRAAADSTPLEAGQYGFKVYSGDELVAEVSGPQVVGTEWVDIKVSASNLLSALSDDLASAELQLIGPSTSPGMRVTQVTLAVDHDVTRQ